MRQERSLAALEADFDRLVGEHAAVLPAIGKRSRADSEATASAPDGQVIWQDGIDLKPPHERYHAWLEALPAAVYVTDAAGRITYYNEAAADLWGHRPELGRSEWCGSWKLYWPDGTPLSHDECPMAVALKEKRAVRNTEAVAERPDGTRVPFLPYPTPLFDESGTLVGAINMLVDITERKNAEERQSLLVRELHHRVKNTLATVQAIMSSTARSSGSMEEFQHAFVGRIGALAKTHSLLTEDHGQAVSFRDLLWAELEPYDDDSGRRIRLSGPPVRLPSELAVSIGMAIHELTTNAVKYGALAEFGGSVEVGWSLATEGGASQLVWTWIERDGPPVAPPTREGFGSRLLRRVLTSQIRADVEMDFCPDGLRVTVVLPLTAPGTC